MAPEARPEGPRERLLPTTHIYQLQPTVNKRCSCGFGVYGGLNEKYAPMHSCIGTLGSQLVVTSGKDRGPLGGRAWLED